MGMTCTFDSFTCTTTTRPYSHSGLSSFLCVFLTLTYTLTLLHLSTYAVAQDDSQPFPPAPSPLVNFSSEQQTWRDRLFTVNDTSPVSRYFRDHSESDKVAQEVFDFIDKVWNVVDKRRENNDSEACNLYSTVGRDWVARMTSRVRVYGIGELDDSCHSKVDVRAAIRTDGLSIMSTSKLRKLFISFRDKYTEAYHALRLWKGEYWRSDGVPFNFTTLDRFQSGQECTIDSIFAHRRNRTWFLQTGATNEDPESSRPDYQRQYLHEYISRNTSVSLRMILRDVENNGYDDDNKNLTFSVGTTALSMWSGRGYDIDGGMSFEDPIGPLNRAYQRNLVTVDLASDAITVSNIAILALPMAMNLVPVAFIADLHAVGMLIYVIVTDVFSTIPFLIKGVELIQSSKPTQEEVYAFFTGNEDLGSMHCWVVLCKGKEQFREVGIAFVVVAVLALVLGIALELWAKRYMYLKRSRAKDSRNVSGPFGQLLEYDVESDTRRMSTYEEGEKGIKQVEELKTPDDPPSTKRRRIIPPWLRR